MALQPGGGGLTLTLPDERRRYTVEWIDAATGAARGVPPIEAAGATQLTPPFTGPAVLLLRAAGD